MPFLILTQVRSLKQVTLSPLLRFDPHVIAHVYIVLHGFRDLLVPSMLSVYRNVVIA